jgi:surface-adhesin protein E
MTQLLLITVLMLSHGSVYAEWVAVEKTYHAPGLQTVYFDPDSIRREGNLSTLWQLTDFKTVQGGMGPDRFLSMKLQQQFDCAVKRLRLLAFTEFSGHMGTGKSAVGYVAEGNWVPIEAVSVNHALWEVACGKP